MSVRKGQAAAKSSQTLEHFLNHWAQTVAQPRVRQRTLVIYQGLIDRHIVPHLGRVPLAKLSPRHVQGWFDDLTAAGVSSSRQRYARVVLQMALNSAFRSRLVHQNAASLIDPPQVQAREIQPFTPQESRAFLKAIEGHPLEGFFTVILVCGLRLGEALGLQWTDVDVEKSTLQVRRALQRFGGDAVARRDLLAERARLLKALQAARRSRPRQVTAALEEELSRVRSAIRAVKTTVQLVEPKSSRSRRTVALPGTVVSALSRQRARQLDARAVADKKWRNTGFVFTTPTGTPLDARNVTRSFKGILAKAGLPTIRIHDLRHSCAMLLLVQGVSPWVVTETLGHSQMPRHLNGFTHVLPELKEEAAIKMDAILANS